MSKLEKITFRPEGEEPVEFYVLEQTRIGGHNYILVTDVEEGDGDALILKDMSQDGEEESIYDVVSDDEELEAVSGVFADMLEDINLILDKYRRSCEKDGLIFIYDLYDWQRGILEALPISTYNGFYAKSDREYTKGMRKNRYFDEIVRSGISDFHGSFREESHENGR